MVDGSAQFFEEATAPEILNALATREGGEILDASAK
jgi:hypothetical protein